MTGLVLSLERFRNLARAVPANERKAAIRDLVTLEAAFQMADQALGLEMRARDLVNEAMREVAR